MGYTALEWRKEINQRESNAVCEFLEDQMCVKRTDDRLSDSLASYPVDEQKRIMARMRLEIEPTNEVDEEGNVT